MEPFVRLEWQSLSKRLLFINDIFMINLNIDPVEGEEEKKPEGGEEAAA